MRILVVCDLGINRSHTLASQLKFLGNDVLTAGIQSNHPTTLYTLCQWADTIILVDTIEMNELPAEEEFLSKIIVWDIGPDVYPRPYNSELLKKAKEFIFEHPEVDNRPLTDKHPEKGIKDPRPKEDNA